MKAVLDQLKVEDKFLGIIFTENEFKVVETEDFFDITLYDVVNHNVTIIIDRNLLIAARELFDKRKIENDRHKFYVSLLAYAIFTNSIFDPTITIYEGGVNESINPIDDTLKLRIIDNISLDTVLDLLYGNIDTFTDTLLNSAKSLTKPLSPELLKENYNKQLDLFKQNYPYMLKAALLLRFPGLNLYRRIKYFFEWMMNEYVTNAAAITLVIYSFYKSGGLIRDYNTTDPNKLIASIKNATWDLTIISYLKEQTKEEPDRYFLLATIDKNLLEAAKYFLSPDESQINELLGNKGEEVQKIIKQTNIICSSHGRKELVQERLDKVDEIIASLEREIKHSVESNNK